MSDETLFYGLAGLVCVGLFLSGLRFARMTHNPWAGKSILGMQVEGSELPVSKVQTIGKVQMAGAMLFAVFLIAAASGWLGPIAFKSL